MQELLGPADVGTPMINTHVLNPGAFGEESSPSVIGMPVDEFAMIRVGAPECRRKFG
jgi:hypothetical protein